MLPGDNYWKKKSANLYKRHRFSPEIIQYAVWPYHRFNLSHRDIEDQMAKSGIVVSYESIRLWCSKFGPRYARRLNHRHLGFGDTFFIDEVFVKISSEQIRFRVFRGVAAAGSKAVGFILGLFTTAHVIFTRIGAVKVIGLTPVPL